MSKPLETFDIVILGGGINGAGIARDAAGRGYKVLLIEVNDIANATSSASSKLAHGGLRYLENYEFRLVQESLKEREVILKNAPHISWPLEFYLPHSKGLRPKWMIWLGLKLYDFLAGFKNKTLPNSRKLSKENLSCLKEKYQEGFSYFDGWVDDARLVMANLLSAKESGVVILTRTICESVIPENKEWRIAFSNGEGKKEIHAKLLINATGPFVNHVYTELIDKANPPLGLKYVKGSHILLPKLYKGKHAYILQHQDGRIVFVLPYLEKFSLVGTTDIGVRGPFEPECSDHEKHYLVSLLNEFFKNEISVSDVIGSFAGVRPLIDDGNDNPAKVTRDYKIIMKNHFEAKAIHIYGGKITTYRKLAENVMEKVDLAFNKKTRPWTQNSYLVGGDLQNKSVDEFLDEIYAQYNFLDKNLIAEMFRRHGERVFSILKNIKSTDELGIWFGHNLYQIEVDYLINFEWAKTAEDILYRRTKEGYFLDESQKKYLNQYIETEQESLKQQAS